MEIEKIEKEKTNSEIKDLNPLLAEKTNSEIEQKYMEIQKLISEFTKKGEFQKIVNLLTENTEIIQKYQEIEKEKEIEKLEKIKEIEGKIEEKIKEIQKLKAEIRDLEIEKKKIQGKANSDIEQKYTEKSRIINREDHEYIYNNKKFNKAIDVIYNILEKYGVNQDTWKNFNIEHSISWRFFIEQVKVNKYPQKNNLIEIINMENISQFYDDVKRIEIL